MREAQNSRTDNHLYLVDGSSYIFRAYHRLPPLTNRHGMNVGAVYGYTTMLWKLADGLNKAEGPTHMAVILDKSEQTFRNQLYDGYKAHRPPPPEDLVPQFPLIRTATRAFSIPCIEEEGLEADDIIACYVTAAKKAGWKVTIVSSDKDLMQLVEDGHVDMLDTMNDRRITEETVREKFGVGPDRVGDVLALMGDSVDNVPGVPGIGPKTATALIQQFGNLEAVLASVDQIGKPKLKQSLIEHADDARLSRELVRLVCEAPLPEPLEELAIKGIPKEPLRAFLEDQGWKSLLTRMVGNGGPNTGATVRNDVAASIEPRKPEAMPRPEGPEKIEIDFSRYETVTDEAALDRWIDEARAHGFVAVDTETDCIDCIIARLAGISLATGPNRACYIPVGHVGSDLYSETPSQLPLGLVLDRLKPLLEDPAVVKVGHNLKYDWVMFDKAGITVAPFDDTMLMSFDLDAGRYGFGHNLTELAKLHFEHECIAFKSLCGTGAKQITFDRVPLREATEYAAEDADITLRLWQRLRPRLTAEHAERVYKRVDRPLVPVIGRMERRGVKVDRDYLAQLSRDFATEIAALEQRIFEAACGPFTIGSTQQLGQVLYERLGLKGGRKGKSGAYSTDVNELERLGAEGVECARLVLDWRQLTKLKSTYTDALQAVINPETGRVHTSFSLTGAQTGRLSSNDPNLQNIPIRTELGRKIRDAFVAEPGHVLMSADYSQIELRLAAHMGDVPQLKEAFRAKADIHNMTAEELFGSSDRESRNKAKTVNFAILYGVSPWGLASRMGVSKDEGQAIIARYFERFPGIRAYMDDTLQFARANGYTQTLFGRKTHFFPNIRSPNPSIRGGAERAAINAPIQGTSADLIKRAMARMDDALGQAGLDGVRMLLQVHDELVFEVPDGREEEAAVVVRRVMEQAAEPAMTLDVPLDVDVGWGEHWGAAH